jgi:hypothetical protein
VKAVLRKDLLLGGGAGTLLCAALVGAALTIGPLLGIDWGGSGSSSGGAEAARLPAIPAVSNPSADALRARGLGPRVVDRRAQPTTGGAAPRPAAQPQPAPSIVGRDPQPTVAPVPAPSGGRGTGTPDTPAIPAPGPAPGLVAPAAAIPATPAAQVAATAKKMKLRVASVGVESTADGTPELRLSLAIDRGSVSAAGAGDPAAVPDQVTVRLRPDLPHDASASGPLSLSAHVDVVDAPAPDNSSDRSVEVPGMQMRVRMSLTPAVASAPVDTPTVADAGDGDGQSQSNVIALSVPLAAFADPEDHTQPAEPTSPDAPPATPAPQTEIRLDLTPAADQNAHPATETATVAAPDAATDQGANADVPVTVVVDSAPQPPAEPAPAPALPADATPAPQPQADPAAQPPADTSAQPPADTSAQPPADTSAQPAPDSSGTTTADATTTSADPNATGTTAAPDASATAPAPDTTATAPDATTAPDASSGAGS